MFCHIPSPKTREISFIKWERNLMLFNVTSTIFKCYPNIMRTLILLRQEPKKNSFWFHLDPHFLTLRESKKGNNICKKHFCLLTFLFIKNIPVYKHSCFLKTFLLIPRDFKILGWCPVGPVLPHREKVPLSSWLATLLVIVSR